VSAILADVRLALRSLLRTPGFTFMVVLILALGIGATTALIDIVRAVVLQPLPYAQPDRLVNIGHLHAERGPVFGAFSPQDFDDLVTGGSTSLSSVGAYMFWPDQSTTNATFPAGPEQLESAFVSKEFFTTFGVQPLLGRSFAADESAGGGGHVVVLSQDAWERYFAADPAALGQTLTINGEPCNVIGVMPAAFAFPDRRVQVWLPLSFLGEDAIPRRRDVRWLDLVGRLAPGVSMESARADIDRVLARLEHDHVDSNEGWGHGAVVGLQEAVVGNTRSVLLLSLLAAALVLMTACVNVASGLLARGSARRQEFALRGALGARRKDLLRHLLVESALLAGAGGVIGLWLAHAALRIFVITGSDLLPRDPDTQFDPWMLAAGGALCLLVTLGCGLLPALGATTAASLGTRSGDHGPRSGKLRASLVVLQIALVSMLLYAALLTFMSLHRLATVDTGVQSSDVLSFNVKFLGGRYDGAGVRDRERGAILERIRALPGVVSAAGAKTFPLGKTGEGYGFTLADRADVAVNPEFGALIVTAGYFQTLGIPFVRGRDFSPDPPAGRNEIVVNRALAQQYWPDADAVGKRLRFGSGSNAKDFEIVGVVGDVRHAGLWKEAGSAVYVSIKDFERSSFTILVRTPVSAVTMFASLREAVHAVDPQLPLARMQAMQTALDGILQRPRLLAALLAVFGCLAAGIAAVGIFGVLAYLVGRRQRELAVRMALGADPARMLRSVLRQGIALGIGGSAFGLVGAIVVAAALRRLLFGVAPFEWSALLAVLVGVVAICALASYFPARRAARVDPNEALREQ